jgi:hypothetical protein
MTNKDLIKQYVDTGISISEYQFNQLSNNLKTTYLRKRKLVGNLIDYELFLLPNDDRTKYINKLNSDGINNLLGYSKEKEKIIDILLSTEGFINKLDSKGISYLLYFSKEPDRIINVLLSTEGFINKLDSNGIHNLLEYSNEPDKIINILGNKGIEFINNLNSNGIGSLLNRKKEPDKIIDILLSSEGFINNLDSYGIRNLLYYSKEKDKIREIIRKYRPDIELNENKIKLSNLI